jgi:hypothetical protein
MADVLIKCPVTKKPVSTGLTTEHVKFESLPDDLTLMLERCPSCLKVHKWEPKEAWVAGTKG